MHTGSHIRAKHVTKACLFLRKQRKGVKTFANHARSPLLGLCVIQTARNRLNQLIRLQKIAVGDADVRRSVERVVYPSGSFLVCCSTYLIIQDFGDIF